MRMKKPVRIMPSRSRLNGEKLLLIAIIADVLGNIRMYFEYGRGLEGNYNLRDLKRDWEWLFCEKDLGIFGNLKGVCQELGWDRKRFRRAILIQRMPERLRAILPRYTEDGMEEEPCPE